MKDYLYDVYLSFTGADRELKIDIRARLEALGFKTYDSDEYCMGQFRQNYMEALDRSRVFLMILSDNLRNDPAITHKGTLTEVRKELSYATELEALNELNIVILNLSEFFSYRKGFHDYNDTIGWLFYTHTRGFSAVYGALENGLLTEKSFSEISSRVKTFIEHRSAGTPVISQAPKIEIASEKITSSVTLYGRDREINAVLDAFREGQQTVALYGIGGMGKTALATEIARKCNDEGLLLCPQIIHIQELAGSGGALHTVVSSVSYEKTVYDSLAYLGERDKYERKLKALSDLQENVLLVIDNYNNISEGDIEDIISKLKCRILITTRSGAALNSSCCTAVKIGCLEKAEAKAMFDSLLSSVSTDDDFSALYDYTGGHTITLCIMAKIIKTHGIGTHELISKLESLENISAKVEFRHNEYGAGDTVLGHLKKLFSISNFSPEALRALRLTSLISDGIIKTEDLVSVLNCSDRNAIIELTKTGWLTEDGDKLYLHPMISHLCAKTLSPNREECAPMLSYILDRAKRERENITYADLAISSERLYYAVYVIAASSGELAYDVWQEFVLACRLIADADEAKRRADAILPLLKNDADRAPISSFSNMALIDANPTNIDILDKYLTDLSESADDYKWVMRALSVTVNHLAGIKETEGKLRDVIAAATSHAVRREDTLALTDLLTYSLYVTDRAEITSQISKYIDKQRATGKNDGMLCNLELMHLYTSISKAKSAADVLQRASKLIETAVSGKFFKYLATYIKHPIFMRALNKTVNRISEIDESDPMSFYFEAVFNASSDIIELGELNVKTMIDAVTHLHAMRLERGMTLASAANSVAGCLAYLSKLPVVLVSDEVSALTDAIAPTDVSVKALSNLHVAMLINRSIGNKNALVQSRQMLKVLERIRPIGHTDVIDARITYANNCVLFGEANEAKAIYRDLITQMSGKIERSSILDVLAHNLMDLIDPDETDVEEITRLFDLATTELAPETLEYQKLFNKYALTVSAIYRNNASAEATMIKIIDMLRIMVKNKSSLSLTAQNWLLSTVHTCSTKICHRDRKLTGELASFLKKLSSGLRGKLSAKAAGLYAELTYGLKMIDTTDPVKRIEAIHGTLAVLTRKHVLKETASSKFTYLLLILKNNPSIVSDARGLCELILSEKPDDELIATVEKLLFEKIVFSAQFTDEEVADRRLGVLVGLMHSNASELSPAAFGISEKNFKRMKRSPDFCRAALDATIIAVEEKTKNNPYQISKRLPNVVFKK